MLLQKLRRLAITLLILGAVGTAAGYAAISLARRDEPNGQRAGARPQVAAKPDDLKPAQGRMFVTGRVLDPHGKPVPNAAVMVYAR